MSGSLGGSGLNPAPVAARVLSTLRTFAVGVLEAAILGTTFCLFVVLITVLSTPSVGHVLLDSIQHWHSPFRIAGGSSIGSSGLENW